MWDPIRQWRELRRFQRLDPAARNLVFYSESPSDWPHLGPVIDHLVGELDRSICYVTSSREDPVLEREEPRIRAFYVGDEAVCTYFFLGLQADVAVLTMPDLESFHKKRSKAAAVHYAYLFHSIVSTHMIYRKGAFDHFDTVFAVGPHHVGEIRAMEQLYDLEPKRVIEHGAPRLDQILEAAAHRGRPPRYGPRRILIAPSWGLQGLLETRAEEWVEALLAAGYNVTVRPHPETGKRWPDVLSRLRALRRGDRFVLETDIRSEDSLHHSDLMISDWSGIALEYAFGLERPVLFVDVPRKVNNEEWQKIGRVPVEDSLRSEIGEIVAPEDSERAAEPIERLCSEPESFRERIRIARERTVFHVGESARVGAEELARLADEMRARREMGA